ncbi:MAG: helix-turn-helix domain-containing protein [Lewinellaceae bacterium]|nr:helix-turn-helix domain-containing protein [Saprospiraceae bacterium]MCB9336600.1 helix-turn-helix domain-containing protein [Lewinellaceae bacterium]
MDFITNPQLDLAFDYVRNTNKNIFLTGKAGTGKTTFLHKIKQEGFKRMVVTAPTGVAAINAGGMTLHSFFQLPFGLHLPGASRDASKQRRFSGQKISLMRSIDLLVIDEISMVRADLLDAVDEVLRRYRDFSKPFGGVQLLMIGDLHQLPPVVKQDEWDLLRHHYQTAYFFGSLALQKTNPVAIELKHIYRQNDEQFIGLLNRVRDNQLDNDVMETLNSRFVPNFHPKEEDGYITLTAHNASAQDINSQRLEAIEGVLHLFNAKIEGDFPQHAYPTEETLEFKEGAQVMFVKNDTNPEKRFFNGKIGQITRIADGEIFVKCKDDLDDIAVSPVDWENIKYTLDEKTKEVKEELLGTFTQYPLKLAWAITIHKSQGLTFERAIIDAQAAFAHGQVYVALSRCKSFEGIVLRTKIGWSSVKTDTVVKDYSEETERNAPDEAHLRQSKREYQQALLRELFSFQMMERYFSQLNRQFLEHGNVLSGEGMKQFREMVAKTEVEVFAMADKFLPQLQFYFNQEPLPEEHEALLERLKKAGGYFTQKLKDELLPAVKSIHLVTDNKAVRKTVQELLENLQKEVFTKNAVFKKCMEGFSTQAYVRAKTDAELDFLASKSTATAASPNVPKNTPHPELYSQLMRWRQDLAADMEVELYEILPTKTILELVQTLPTDSISLKRVKGIGDVKIKLFGADLMRMIEQYCASKNIPTNLLPPLAPPKPDTKQVSFDMFKSGKNLVEIALERGLTVGTIEGHLSHFIEKGELEITDLLDKEKVDEIAAFFTENNTVATSAAKEHFGEKYSYGELRMVLGWLKRKE